MLETKCVKGYRPLQHRNGVTRFKQVEDQSRNHALRKRTCCQFMHENGNSLFCVCRLRHRTTSCTGLMRPIFVNNQTMQYLTEILHHLTVSTVTTLSHYIKPLGLCTPINKNTEYVSVIRVIHISCTPPKKVSNTFYFGLRKEFLTRFLLHYVLSF